MFGHGSPSEGRGRSEEARRDWSVADGGSGSGSGRRQTERPLVRLVGLREAERHVERERELEQHECDSRLLAASLQDRQQLAVVTDRLVERVLLPRAVTGHRQVRDRLVLVVRGEPVVGEQPATSSSRPA